MLVSSYGERGERGGKGAVTCKLAAVRSLSGTDGCQREVACKALGGPWGVVQRGAQQGESLIAVCMPHAESVKEHE